MSAAVEEVTRRLAEAMGVPYGSYQTHETEPDVSVYDAMPSHGGQSPMAYKRQMTNGRWITTVPSGIYADHNSTYGGWVIEQMAPNGRTWISKPFGETRRTRASFIKFIEEKIAWLEREEEE